MRLSWQIGAKFYRIHIKYGKILFNGSVLELKKNYFAKLVNYTKKVLNIERSLSKLSDGRKNPKYKTKELVLISLV